MIRVDAKQLEKAENILSQIPFSFHPYYPLKVEAVLKIVIIVVNLPKAIQGLSEKA